MKRLVLLLFLALAFVSFGYGKEEYVAHYMVRLDEVTCDGDCGFVQDMKAESFRDLDNVLSTRYIYEDDVLKMSWYVSDFALNYSIFNKIDSTLVLLAHTIAYMGADRIESSVGYTLERQKVWPVVYIDPGTYCMGFMVPEKNYAKAQSKSLSIKPLFPNYFASESQAWRRAGAAKGERFVLRLPVYQAGLKWIYHLTFVVDGVTKVTVRDKEEELEETSADPPSDREQRRETERIRKAEEETRKEAEAMAAARPGADSCYLHGICPQEKVYIHLDNTAYFEGETIWFAANVVDASTGLEPASKVLYVELLSPTGVVLRQQKLKIVDGRCHGSFPLIDADVKEAVALRGALPYPSGYYQIRAYTRSMLTYDAATIFSRVIPVYEAPDRDGHYDNPLMAPYDNYERDRPEEAHSQRLHDLNVTYFPEGGNLVVGVPCRIAYKMVDNHGMGVDVDSIHDSRGHIVPILCQHRGMGVVALPGHYIGRGSLTFFVGDTKKSFALPAASRQGYSLSFHQEGDSLRFDITSLQKSYPLDLHYALTSGGRLCFEGNLTVLDANTVSVVLPRQPLPTGVAQFTLCDVNDDILAQRLLFVDNGMPVVTLSAEMDSPDLQPYDSVCLHLRSGQSEPCTFSLAVRDAADYGTAYRDDIRTYMLLSSELKGLIEDPAWYFENGMSDLQNGGTVRESDKPLFRDTVSKTERMEALDLLMMVQGWTRHDYTSTVHPEELVITDWPEEGLVLDGWAFSRVLEHPLKNTLVSVKLYSPNRKYKQVASALTDSTGYWRINLADFDGEWDLYLFTQQSATNSKKRTTRVRLGRSEAPPLGAYRPEEMFLPDYQGDEKDLLSWKMTKNDGPLVQIFPDVKDIINDGINLDEVQIEDKRRYIDYNRFHAFNAAHDAELVVDKGKYTGDVLAYLEQKGYGYTIDYPPLGDGAILADKTMTQLMRSMTVSIDNHTTYWQTAGSNRHRSIREDYIPPWAIDMEDVKSVIVYDYEPGHRYVDVVINMLNNQEHKNNTNNSRQTSYAGYTIPGVEFYAPTYPDGPIPGDKDYRRTIYWNPEVTTDANGAADVSFYNNGYSRSLTVSAEGLTKDGVPLLLTK